MSKAAVLLAVISLNGFFSPTRAASPLDRVPFELTRDSVLHGVPLKVGDLNIVSELEAEALAQSAAADPSQWERCLQAGPEWLRRSDDGTSLELTHAWQPSRDRILTAYCADGRILVAGYERSLAGDDPGRAWIFQATEGRRYSWSKTYLTRPYPVGPFGRQTQYRLNEVRAIDPVSRQILFAGTAENGRPVLLAAPFLLAPAALARN